MKKIYKYVLDTTELNEIGIQMGAEILSVQMQRGQICMWAMIDDKNKFETKIFRIIGTGKDIPVEREDMKYMGTVQDRGYVWHIFMMNDTTEAKISPEDNTARRQNAFIEDLKFQINHYEEHNHVDTMTEEEELAASEGFRKGAEYGRSKTLQLVRSMMKKHLGE